MSQQPPGVDDLDAALTTFAELVPLMVVMDSNTDGGTVLFTDAEDKLPVTSVPVVAMLFGATICVGCSGDKLDSVSGSGVTGVDEADVGTSDAE